jgi:hypothetical protein
MENVVHWWRQRVLIPRWVLTLEYIGLAVLGTVAIVIGIPTLDLTTIDGYTTIWGCWVTFWAVGAALGSFQERWETIERWTGVALVSFLVVYSVLAIAHGRQLAGVVIVIMMTLIPAVRVAYLLTRTGLPAGRPPGAS